MMPIDKTDVNKGKAMGKKTFEIFKIIFIDMLTY